jgi:hypothetical protein
MTTHGAGPTITSNTRTLCIPSGPKFTFPTDYLVEGTWFRYIARGIISCVVTTPGTARFDFTLGGTIVFDTGAMNLNVVAKTNVPWTLEIDFMVETAPGSATQLWSQGTFSSEAVIASPLPSVGGNGLLNVPVSGLALSTAVDSTTSLQCGVNFTQTVATGSMTLKLGGIVLLN